MYVTTFYSFKGGVGRTLALVNVGVELAQSGRRVLLVDFDLEAPGLHTFDVLKPPTSEPRPGIVEYVTTFVATRKAPKVRDYIYESAPLGQRGGRLWVMPAGSGGEQYRAKLAAIGWQRLYRDLDGYVLFEDLKAQWQQDYAPDYVLVDSRTGHSDVEGICTRQLPDAVVVLFFPNEQNLAGLRTVVNDIRAETQAGRRREITLHYVMSNVPDLDDEDGVLKNRKREFRDALQYDQPPVTIRHYPSLALVSQVVFTREHPKSRLAQEYRILRDTIAEANINDRDGAVHLIDGLTRESGSTRYRVLTPRLEQRLGEIRKVHSKDGDLLYRLASLYVSEYEHEAALALFDQAIEAGNHAGAVFLERATGRYSVRGDRDGARADIEEALKTNDLGAARVARAIRILREVDENALAHIPQTAAVRSLPFDGRLRIVRELTLSRPGLPGAVEILSELLGDKSITVEQRDSVATELCLCYVGLGQFEEAQRLISTGRPAPSDLSLAEAFNYAMAEWGRTGQIPAEFFRRVVDLDESLATRRDDANYSQCLTLALWAAGHTELACIRIDEAEKRAGSLGAPDFSCWRYLRAQPHDFREDCRSIRKLMAGEHKTPLFFR